MSETSPINPGSSEPIKTPETNLNDSLKDFLTGKTGIDSANLGSVENNQRGNQYGVILDIDGTQKPAIKLSEATQDGRNYTIVGYEGNNGQRLITALEIPSVQK